MDNRAEIREFLVSRRGRITPEQAGVETFGERRRVTGLRREEVARLAGVSVDYFTRLERGDLKGVSDAVLESIAAALRLDDAEREHLFDLARAAGPVTRRRPMRPVPATVRPEIQYLLDAITEAPAVVANNRMDIIAANALGYAMHSPMFTGRERPANHARFIFLDPRAAEFYPDWERAANTNVAILRREAGRTPHDKGLSDLVGELSVRSEEFRARWAAHNVRQHYAGAKSFRHPVVGLLELNYVTIALDGDPGLAMTTYPATPDSPSAEALKLLASWAATEDVATKFAASTATA
jgi:transcriptional regulator with XRE-family HTH domain